MKKMGFLDAPLLLNRLKKLEYLDIGNCYLTSLPDSLESLQDLKSLKLTGKKPQGYYLSKQLKETKKPGAVDSTQIIINMTTQPQACLLVTRKYSAPQNCPKLKSLSVVDPYLGQNWGNLNFNPTTNRYENDSTLLAKSMLYAVYASGDSVALNVDSSFWHGWIDGGGEIFGAYTLMPQFADLNGDGRIDFLWIQGQGCGPSIRRKTEPFKNKIEHMHSHFSRRDGILVTDPGSGVYLHKLFSKRRRTSMPNFRNLGLFLLALTFGVYAQSDWTWRNPTATANTLLDVTWAGTQFVAVGGVGTIVTSPDGIKWTLRSTKQEADLTAITWTGQLLVAVGDSGIILTSPDGVDWTSRSPGPKFDLKDVVWSGRLLVAAGWQDTLLTSTDGIDWTVHAGAMAGALNSMVWTGTQFVGVGVGGGSGVIQTSPDGLAWTRRTNDLLLELNSVAWTGTRLVAVGKGFNGLGNILISQDGVTWEIPPPNPDFFDPFLSIVWTGKVLVMVARGGVVFTSPDGAIWTRVRDSHPAFAQALAWNGSHLVAVGEHGEIYASQDGTGWLNRISEPTVKLYAVIWTGSDFVTVGAEERILTSPDGVAWTSRHWVKNGTGLLAVAANGKQLVAVGAGGWILSSPDGLTWTSQQPNMGRNWLYGVAYNGSKWVIVGDRGTIFTSTDGVTWDTGPPEEEGGLRVVIWTGTQWMAMGGAQVKTSSDGTNWTSAASPLSVTSLVWTGKQFAAVGLTTELSRAVFTSPDGVVWTSHVVNTTAQLNSVVWSGTELVMVGEHGSVFTSPDGIDWSLKKRVFSYELTSIAWNGRQFAAVGERGTILTSPGGTSPIRMPGSRRRPSFSLRVTPSHVYATSPSDLPGPGIRTAIYTMAGDKMFEQDAGVVGEPISMPIGQLGNGGYLFEMKRDGRRFTAPFRISR